MPLSMYSGHRPATGFGVSPEFLKLALGVLFYDLPTNKEFTLKTRRMVRADLDDFGVCYRPKNRNQRKPTSLRAGGGCFPATSLSHGTSLASTYSG